MRCLLASALMWSNFLMHALRIFPPPPLLSLSAPPHFTFPCFCLWNETQECAVTEAMVLWQQYLSVTGTRRKVWFSASLHRRNAWEWGKRDEQPPPFFTTRSDISVAMKLIPNFIYKGGKNVSESYLLLSCNTPVDSWSKLRQDFLSSSLTSLKAQCPLSFLSNIPHIFSFVTLHLYCPPHILERQIKVAVEINITKKTRDLGRTWRDFSQARIVKFQVLSQWSSARTASSCSLLLHSYCIRKDSFWE